LSGGDIYFAGKIGKNIVQAMDDLQYRFYLIRPSIAEDRGGSAIGLSTISSILPA